MTEPLVYYKERLAEFWWLARERYSIKLKKDAGLPRSEWTSDPTLSHYHFCNVFRADDRTSVAIREWAGRSGDPWRAVVFGRLINRAETIREMMEADCRDPADMGRLARDVGINTNAYRLNTPRGLNSVDGLIELAALLLPRGPAVLSSLSVTDGLNALAGVPCVAGFVGYQMLVDLLDLGAFLPGFDDDRAWPGPGANRATQLLLGRDTAAHWNDRKGDGSRRVWAEATDRTMRYLLRQSRRPENWPWLERPWSIHEVEFMLCEYDKWRRKSSGQSKSGRIYRGVKITS